MADDLLTQFRHKADRAIDEIYTDGEKAQNVMADNYRYYYGELPPPDPKLDEYGNPMSDQHEGSKYVAPVAWEAVESIVSAAVETFNASRRPVEYSPAGRQDVEQANDFARVTFWEDNQGVKIIRESFQRAGIAKLGVVAVYWDDATELQKESVVVTRDQVMALSNMSGVTMTDARLVGPGILQVEFEREVPARKITVEGIDPEMFGVDGEGLGEGEWIFIYHQERVLDDELISQGVPEDIVKRLPTNMTVRNNDVRVARNSVDGSRGGNYRNPLQNSFPQRVITHCFFKALDENNRLKTWYLKYGKGSDAVLAFSEVQDHFYAFVQCYPIAGKCYPRSAVEAVQDNHNAQSKFMREGLNNMDLANHDRTEVNLNQIHPDHRDKAMQASERLGGTYMVRGPEAIRNIPRVPLPQEMPLMLSYLQQDAEARSGYSRVAKGTAAEVISQQNAAAMVDKYVQIGSRRIAAMMALNAEQFMERVYRLIYDAAIDHADELDGREIEVEGRMVPIMPSRWSPKCQISRKPVLTDDERQARAAALIEWDRTMIARTQQDPETRFFYQSQNAAFLYREAADLLEFPVSKIMTEPGSPEFQRAMKQHAQKQAEAQRMEQARLASEMAQREEQARIAQENIEAQTMKTMNDIEATDDEQELKEQEFEHSVIMDLMEQRLKRQELEVERQQERGVSIG